MPVEEVGFAGAVWIKAGRIDTVGVSAQADKGLPLRRERDRVDDEYRGRFRLDRRPPRHLRVIAPRSGIVRVVQIKQRV